MTKKATRAHWLEQIVYAAWQRFSNPLAPITLQFVMPDVFLQLMNIAQHRQQRTQQQKPQRQTQLQKTQQQKTQRHKPQQKPQQQKTTT
jgi:hypothetical protein